MKKYIEFSLVCSDVREMSADVLVLKYAQGHYGVSRVVSDLLEDAGVSDVEMMPDEDDCAWVDGRQILKFGHVLWMGVPWLHDFGYDEIKKFSEDSLAVLQERDIRSVVYTMHGAGYGLDEKAAVFSQMSGMLEALKSGNFPHSLQEIYLVESHYNRFKIIRELLDDFLRKYKVERGVYHLPICQKEDFPEDRPDALKQSHVFVAMPFDQEMSDVFYYGIQAPIHRHELLCERVDQDVFTGDILVRIQERIESSLLVVADISGMNPNVYLEVGYAWGLQKPVVLVMKEGCQMKFDVQGQRCVIYKTIRELEEKLSNVIAVLKPRLVGGSR